MPRPMSGAPICCAHKAITSRRLSDLNQAIKLNPEAAEAYHARGLIYQSEGDHAHAITDFANAIDRNPFVAAPYLARGQSLIATGKYDLAIADFNAALNVDNTNADAWASLGLAYERSGNRAKAMKSYRARSSSIRITSSPATAVRASSRVRGGSSLACRTRFRASCSPALASWDKGR